VRLHTKKIADTFLIEGRWETGPGQVFVELTTMDFQSVAHI
jgi:hypothetical protein